MNAVYWISVKHKCTDSLASFSVQDIYVGIVARARGVMLYENSHNQAVISAIYTAATRPGTILWKNLGGTEGSTSQVRDVGCLELF
jgi:hypothetical protein